MLLQAASTIPSPNWSRSAQNKSTMSVITTISLMIISISLSEACFSEIAKIRQPFTERRVTIRPPTTAPPTTAPPKTAPPTAYMKKLDIDITGHPLEDISDDISTGFGCWLRCRDRHNCDLAHFEPLTLRCRLFGKNSFQEVSGPGLAYFRAEAPPGYTVRLGDCPGNDLWGLYRSNTSLETCAQLCSQSSECRAFMWYDRHECYPKSASCELTSLANTRNVSYSKLDLPEEDECPPGSYCTIRSVVDPRHLDRGPRNERYCQLCPRGYYMDEMGAEGQCKPCLDETNGNVRGATECLRPAFMAMEPICLPGESYRRKRSSEPSTDSCTSDLTTSSKLNKFLYLTEVHVGSPGQPLQAILDTGSSWMGVALDGNGRSYHPRRSSSSVKFRRLNQDKVARYGSGDTIVYKVLYEDTVRFGHWGKAVQKQKFLGGKFESTLFHNEHIHAILGLRPTRPFDRSDPAAAVSLVTSMLEQDLLRESLFAFTYRGQGTSRISFGGLDETAYTGPVQYVPLKYSSAWCVGLDGVSVAGRAVVGSGEAILDSGATMITGPNSAMKAILRSIPNSCEHFPSGFPTVTFVLGGAKYDLWPQDYIHDATLCTSVFVDLSQNANRSDERLVNLDKFVLGVPFMKSVYTVFHVGRKAIGFAEAVREIEVEVDIHGMPMGS